MARQNKTRYRNVENIQADRSTWEFLKWKISHKFKRVLKPDNFVPAVDKESFRHFFNESYDGYIWIGHATFLYRLSGKYIITDPFLRSTRFLKRIPDLPIPISEFPEIDYLLVSHAHLDHLDLNSINSLSIKEAILPKGMTRYFSRNSSIRKFIDLDWYEEISRSDVKFGLAPSHHWSRRSINDVNKVLWGSFYIECRGLKLYFAGDTAFSKHFEQINSRIGSFDYAFLPIGAYEPRSLMRTSHMNPEEACLASNILNSKNFVPMHYQTIDLTDEPLEEPLFKVNKLAENDDELSQKLKIATIGTAYRFERKKFE